MLLAQNQSPPTTENSGWRGRQYDPNGGVKLGAPGTIPKWKGSRGTKGYGCFYCGGKDHFIPECEEMKEDVKNGLVKMNPDGKLRLSDGSFIPNVPNTVTIKEKVMKYYAKRQTQYYLGYDEDEGIPSSSVAEAMVQSLNVGEDPVQRRARLEREVDLKAREEALELKEIKLEREERKKEQNSKAPRTAHVLEILEQLTDEDLAAIKAVKSDFQ